MVVTCPCCGFKFAVIPIESRGFCRCGMDYVLRVVSSDPPALSMDWTPDPCTDSAGAEPVSELHVLLADA